VPSAALDALVEARSGPGWLTTGHAASTSAHRAEAEPRFEIRYVEVAIIAVAIRFTPGTVISRSGDLSAIPTAKATWSGSSNHPAGWQLDSRSPSTTAEMNLGETMDLIDVTAAGRIPAIAAATDQTIDCETPSRSRSLPAGVHCVLLGSRPLPPQRRSIECGWSPGLAAPSSMDPAATRTPRGCVSDQPLRLSGW
jgi:hypothetical protein